MTEASLFHALLVAWFALSLLVCPVLLFMPAPYGRHAAQGWGPLLPAKQGWLLMELPAVLVMGACFWAAPSPPAVAWVFFAMWQLHYIHRAVIFPWRLHPQAKGMPLSVALMGFAFNCVNGYLNGRWLTVLGDLSDTGLGNPRCIAGLGIFVAGLVINLQSDSILLGLRRAKQGANPGYSIPRSGLFRWISCPNYLGEVMEWTGWALATGSLPGAAFAVWTFANLMPRALAHHQWYQRTFPDYPRERRALFPGVL